MRRIAKGPEPACLQEIRNTPGATTWMSIHGSCKQSLREAAFAEQHGLCAYCQSRLTDTNAPSSRPEGKGMKIEHWASRSASPELTLDWHNLLGVCPGVVTGGAPVAEGSVALRRAAAGTVHGAPVAEGSVALRRAAAGTVHRPRDEQGNAHCDTFRGRQDSREQTLHYNPARFPPDVGTLFRYTTAGEMTSDDREAAQDIERLNLNVMRLKRNRAGAIKELRKQLEQPPRRATLNRLYEKAKSLDRQGRLPAYSQSLVYYLEKKMRQVGMAPPR